MAPEPYKTGKRKNAIDIRKKRGNFFPISALLNFIKLVIFVYRNGSAKSYEIIAKSLRT